MSKNKEINQEITEDQLADVLFNHRHRIETLEKLKIHSGAPVVRITSAKELSESEKETILSALDQAIDYNQHQVQFLVDPSLIAGYRIQTRSYYYDNSLKRKLEDMRRHIVDQSIEVQNDR